MSDDNRYLLETILLNLRFVLHDQCGEHKLETNPVSLLANL